jgi:ISXO2-like transposase domain
VTAADGTSGRILGPYETAWAWLHKLRRAMVPTSGPLTGTVEVDVPFARSVVAPGATVMTDGWHPYRPLARHGYAHVRHVQRGSGKQWNELLPACHRVAELVKRWLLGTHQGSIRPEHLDYYLDEFTFCFNRRRSNHRGLLFYRLLEQAAQTAPQPYTSLLSPAVGVRRRAAQAARASTQSRGLGRRTDQMCAGDAQSDPAALARGSPTRRGGAATPRSPGRRG